VIVGGPPGLCDLVLSVFDGCGLRELWLADPRIGASHSRVTEERGLRGRWLPKGVSALAAVMRPLGGAPLLEALLQYNSNLCLQMDRRNQLAIAK
jgi:hypothetical protein